jgi:hypothetical protein
MIGSKDQLSAKKGIDHMTLNDLIGRITCHQAGDGRLPCDFASIVKRVALAARDSHQARGGSLPCDFASIMKRVALALRDNAASRSGDDHFYKRLDHRDLWRGLGTTEEH